LKASSAAPKVGIALGSGASRGWSHIGVLKALLKGGIEPAVVCGTSVGAMVGASYLAGNLGKLEDWVLGSSRADVLRFFSFRLANSGFVDRERFNWFLHNFVAAEDIRIEKLDKPYAAVCTDLDSGSEVSLCEGGLASAVRASMAMPGLFPAERAGQRWLVDGGLVNPVPVSVCRKLGADFVIGVNLNAEILGRHRVRDRTASDSDVDSILGQFRKHASKYSNSFLEDEIEADKTPGLFAAISHTINIFQDQITRGRLATNPADVLIAPKVGDIGMFDFQRAADAIIEGEGCMQDAMAEVRRQIGC
jgi:NTE family protein